jgi:hypothetical protein
MGGVSEYATTVVRLFPDYANSVLWFPYPLAYEETRLDAQLIEDCKAWEASYYVGVLPTYSWQDATLKAEFVAEGGRLACRLAAEIGDEFQVEHDRAGGRPRRVRSRGPARNPDAAAALRELARAATAEWDEARRVVNQARRAGQTLEWRA